MKKTFLRLLFLSVGGVNTLFWALILSTHFENSYGPTNWVAIAFIFMMIILTVACTVLSLLLRTGENHGSTNVHVLR